MILAPVYARFASGHGNENIKFTADSRSTKNSVIEYE